MAIGKVIAVALMAAALTGAGGCQGTAKAPMMNAEGSAPKPRIIKVGMAMPDAKAAMIAAGAEDITEFISSRSLLRRGDHYE